jgi:trehalose 6-phosphate synthase
VIKKAIALAIAAGSLIWVRHLGSIGGSDPSVTALALGFTLLVAWIAGDLMRRFRLPRVTGYLLFGLIIGPYLGNIVTTPMAAQLDVVTRIATTLIALMAGLMLNVSRLGTRLRAVLRLAATTLTVTMAGILVLAWLAWSWLPIAPDATGVARLAMAAMLALIASSFSPTMTAAVIAETGTRARFAELVLAIVVVADLVLLVAFSLALPLTRAALGAGGGLGANLLLRLVWEVGGAVAFGAFVGAMLALYMRYVAREVTLVLFGVCALLSQVGATQDLQPLLAAVTAGLVIENVASAQGNELRGVIQRGATPVLLIFFVSVGTSLRFDVLVTGGVTALAIVLVRLFLLRTAVSVGVRATAPEDRTLPYTWTGLVSQAGITLGFAATLASEFPEWGGRVQMLLVAMMAVNELAGPLLFRRGLLRANQLEGDLPAPLIVVSNREPYVHRRGADGSIAATASAGGVAVALDALMRRRGGVWIAHGAGDADRAVVDAADKVSVPPDAPAYDLRRLWIDDDTFSAYYGGFANEGLWPLCHQVDVRPAFRPAEWQSYRQVNEQFASAIAEEMRDEHTPVFIQDYHLALVAGMLRDRMPRVRTALFWHIPWPHPDRLRICPWHHELVQGLLANDLIAFQLDRDRRNFLHAIEEWGDAVVDTEASQVVWRHRRTAVATVPIGVDFDRIQTLAASESIAAERWRLTQSFSLHGRIVGVGVDRLDYTKGIPERLDALERLLESRPELSRRLTFVQVGVPSRTELRDYAMVEEMIGRRIDELNAKYARPGDEPVVRYHHAALGLASLVALYQLADFCVVSSLHDGMNLVAKEFVASRQDEDGVLVLSSLAGAAQELTDALLINPYDVEGFAAALMTAIDMPREERQRRMRAMREIVAGRDVFLWASDILEGLEPESLVPLPLRNSDPEPVAV